MIRMFFDVSDMFDLLTDFLEMSEIKQLLDEASGNAADVVVYHAKQLVPVDTGALKNSISSYKIQGGREVGSRLQYSLYVEFGTKRSPAQPFLAPAYDNHMVEVYDAYVSTINNFIEVVLT